MSSCVMQVDTIQSFAMYVCMSGINSLRSSLERLVCVMDIPAQHRGKYESGLDDEEGNMNNDARQYWRWSCGG